MDQPVKEETPVKVRGHHTGICFFSFLLHVSWGLNTGLLAWQPYLQALFFVFNKTSCSPTHYVAKYGIKLLVLLPPPFLVRPEIPDLGFVSEGD